MVWLRAKGRRVSVRDGHTAAHPMIELSPHAPPTWFENIDRARFVDAHDVAIVDSPPPDGARPRAVSVSSVVVAAEAAPKRKRGRPRKKVEG